MGSHILDILRQGIWASLAGGWFYDPQQQVFCNTFHLYVWALLLAFPIVVFAIAENTFLGWSLYCAAIGILFTVVKFINFKLHYLFDTGEAEEEVVSEGGASDAAGKEQESKGGGDSHENEYIEMSNLGASSASGGQPGSLKPTSPKLETGRDHCSDALPVSLAASLSKAGKAPLAEEEGDDIVTVGARRLEEITNSRNADDEDDSLEEEEEPPHTFITKAEIEHTPVSSSSDIVNVTLSDGNLKHLLDAGQNDSERNDGSSPDSKRRNQVQESVADEHGKNNKQVKKKESSDEVETQPKTESIERRNSAEAGDGSGIINDLKMETEREKPRLRVRRERKAIRRSKSSQEWSKSKSHPNKAKLSSQSLNMPSAPSTKLPVIHHSTSSNSDWSDISFGEVEIPDPSSVSYGQDNLFLALNSQPVMSSSVDESSGSTVVATSSSHSGDTASPSTDTSSSVNADHVNGPSNKDLDLTTPSSPSAEDLALMKSQGAIPKQMKNRNNHDHSNPKESTSPGSTDLSDPEEIQRRVLMILWEPHQYTEEVRQLQQIVKMQKNLSNGPAHSTPKKDASEDGQPELLNDEGEGELSENNSKNLTCQENDRKSATTPTEFSALLPANPQLNRPSNRRARRRRGRRQQQLQQKESLPIEALSMVVGDEGHIAYSHDDTTDGAVHWFQDEQGNWMSYTFGEKSTGIASDLTDVNANATSIPEPRRQRETDNRSLSSNASNSTVIIEESTNAEQGSQAMTEMEDLEPGIADMHFAEDFLQDYVRHLLRVRRRNAAKSSTDSDTTNANLRTGPKPKHFYKFWLWPFKLSIKIRFDRLALLAALDRNISVIENVISVILAMGVGALGALMITSNFYHDLCLLLFCFIMAGCQYSLLKSVQPDAASPMHGYNRVIVFSRPFYFCLCCSIVLLLDSGSKTVHNKPIYLYGIPFTITSALTFLRNFFRIFILFFPVLFTLGLLPQVNTFLMYMLEQVDMHVFGGNATTSLSSSFYCVCRSCLSVLTLYGFAYASLKNIGEGEYKCGQDMEDAAQTVPFSILCGLLVSLSYHLSRSASDPGVLWMFIKSLVVKDHETKSESDSGKKDSTELIDPLPGKLRECLKQRLESDAIVCIAVGILVFAVHVSTAFTSPALHPVLSDILYLIAASVGFLVHYVIPQTRKEMPWLCCSHPLLRSKEWMFFEVKDAPKMMWIERLYLSLRFIERNVIYPVVCLCATTTSAPAIICKFGNVGGPMIILVCSMKMLRFAFSDSPRQYPIITVTYFFFKYDFQLSSETFLIDYFFISILVCKFSDFLLKLNFIITYIAPWQITWGSAFHAFAQPFSVPHSAMLFLQATVSAIFSTPLNPFLGSAIFFTSYVRPVKFWERDYNTKRVDHTNTRLASQLDRNPGADDNNLNSIFYEHLTRSLQHSLCGDLLLGRWGNYTQGDCFIMASDYLNALVHIIEVGNGLVTFQLRGLEFRGTYCQQREVEAITEGLEDNGRFCCWTPGHLPHFLSVNAAFNQRWLAWEVVVSRYILEGYSISDNSAATMLQVWELRKALITYYIKSIIYYTVRSPNLENWLENPTVRQAQEGLDKDSYVDLDPTFNYHIDEDYDSRLKGISRASFCQTYLAWIQHCANRRDKTVDSSKPSMLVSLCFSLSLLGRRALNAASQNSASVDFFLFGLHALFKGDFRIQSPRDEWVFADMDMIRRVVAPAVRMSLKLHQDHFTCPDEYDDSDTLYTAITEHERTMVISHEADPAWRNAVLSNVPSLLALRHVFDEGTDEYKIIMLNKRYLGFRIVKVNRECVRGLWAGQQQELIFLRNRNPERGSIQNAKQALRNMINSSCDQPIGYPIYVSPLTTSYATTHNQLKNMPIIGEEFRFGAVRNLFTSLWNRVRQRCDATCAGGSASFDLDHPYSVSHQMAAATIGCTPRQGLGTQTIDIPLQPIGNRGSLISNASSASKVNTLASLANLTSLINETSVKDNLPHRVRILDPNQVYDAINLGRRIEVQWPNEDWKTSGGKSGWRDWIPKKGMEGTVVHKWIPGHPDPIKRSHTDKTILLIQVRDHFVPIAETGVFDLGAEV